MSIKKIKLFNFKKFNNLEVKYNEKINLLIGDNEAGKSTILQAVDIVLSGSRYKVENIGLENIFNRDIIDDFLASNKNIENLPILSIELYLTEQHNQDLNGKNNSDELICDGLQMICEPDNELSKEITEILEQEDDNFPFEYYTIKFYTFSGEPYTGYKKYIKHLIIDSSQINNEYATREYIKAVYNSLLIGTEKNKHYNEYRKFKEEYREDVLSNINNRLGNNNFTVQTNSKSNLETDLTISDENGVTIENRGKGQQCFIKTEFALKIKDRGRELDIILLEEPENHLSHINMKKLINMISKSHDKQIFITTHNSLISTRLDLRKSILLNSNASVSIELVNLPEQTAKFFMKAPNNYILEYILSKKVILVEGDAEFILMEALYKNIIGEELADSGVHIISVGGTSFKRYLDIAKLLKIKTAVIRDNDGDYEQNVVNRYDEYLEEYIKIFSNEDNDKTTLKREEEL